MCRKEEIGTCIEKEPVLPPATSEVPGPDILDDNAIPKLMRTHINKKLLRI